MSRSFGSFECPKCKTPYRTQAEADRCGSREEGEPQHHVGKVVRYTFFSMRPVGRDEPETLNRWRVLDPKIALIPDGDGRHQHLVQVEQIEFKRGSTKRAIDVFPEMELI